MCMCARVFMRARPRVFCLCLAFVGGGDVMPVHLPTVMLCLQVVLATVWDKEEIGGPRSKYGEAMKNPVFLWAIWSAGLSGELNLSV